MSGQEFAQLIEREHEQIELKTGVGRRSLQAALVAMSNADGGLIIIGVDDQRRIVGRRRDQGLDDEINGARFDALNVGRVDIAEVTVEDQSVVVVAVQPRLDDVAQTSDGRVLIRQGGHNRALSPREVADLYSRRSRIRFESTDSGVGVEAVDSTIASEVARACGWPDGEANLDRWLERGLVHASGNLTVAGALVLTDPDATLRAAKFRVDVRVYNADTGTSYVNRQIIGGPVQAQVAEAADLVTRFVGTEMVITGSRRHDVARLPGRVVREAIANAVAHRTYERDESPIVVEVRPGSVVVLSPGRLPDSVTIQTLRQAQAARNHSVIDILRRFGLAEDSGQGIDVMQDAMRLELLEEPTFDEEADSFRVELPLRGVMSTTERGWLAEFERTGIVREGERLLLLTISREGRVTNARARDVLAIDSTEARARLQRLRSAGVLVQHGTRGRAYYTLGTVGPQRSDERAVLDEAAAGRVTNQRVRELTGLDRVAARALLKRLVTEGQLAQHGSRRGTFYTAP